MHATSTASADTTRIRHAVQRGALAGLALGALAIAALLGLGSANPVSSEQLTAASFSVDAGPPATATTPARLALR